MISQLLVRLLKKKKKVFNESNLLQWISAINSKYVPMWGMPEVSKIILIQLRLLKKKKKVFSSEW